MKEGEAVLDYNSKLSGFVNQMSRNGEKLDDTWVFEKMIQSPTPSFEWGDSNRRVQRLGKHEHGGVVGITSSAWIAHLKKWRCYSYQSLSLRISKEDKEEVVEASHTMGVEDMVAQCTQGMLSTVKEKWMFSAGIVSKALCQRMSKLYQVYFRR